VFRIVHRSSIRDRFASGPALACALLVSLTACEDRSPTEPAAPVAGEQALAATAVTWRQVSTGTESHTCAVTTTDQAYCWGGGPLGHGLTFVSRTPLAVLGGLAFRDISAGALHTCGVTVDFRAYCWGSNFSGQLGNGSAERSNTPIPVVGGLSFRHVSAGLESTCGITTGNRAYCWGSGANGKLGNGASTGTNVPSPVAVAGGHSFRQVTVGSSHACAITPANQTFCWGDNTRGRLGTNSTIRFSATPARVLGGLNAWQISAGHEHTCLVTTGDKAYCWGSASSGQIGDGGTVNRWEPRAVLGGIAFDRVSAGVFHTCGETTANRVYCWGGNNLGALGDGTRTDRSRPRAVSGDLRFSQVDAGGFYTCGVTPTGAAYCWGFNQAGQLGDGSSTDRLTPTRVADPV
jgi:alpha-tubulin suppressor-like RCC1 family protein